MAMSTRTGGVSQGAFRSLNLSFRVDDHAEAVLANREILCETLSLPLSSTVFGQQVHGTHVEQVSRQDRGRGATCWEDDLPGTDAMVTDQPGLALVVLAADCAPVFFHDPIRRAIGIAHGSWRSTLHGIMAKTVDKMKTAFQSDPRSLQARIGPSIGPCCYEVGRDILEILRRSCPGSWPDCLAPQDNGAMHLNLWETIRQQLIGCGLEESNISTAGLCTACHAELFFSHRRDKGRTGRMGAVIALPGEERETNPAQFHSRSMDRPLT